jgi:putative endopeptidase
MFGKGMRLGAIVFIGVFLASKVGSSEEPSAPSQKSDFLAANLDGSVSPGDDFFRYANGGWFKRNPIPPTESTWGISHLVRDQLNVNLRAINISAAAKSAKKGTDDQKIGDFWATAMDVGKAQRLGVRPLRRDLARIDAVKNLAQTLDAAFALQRLEVNVLFRVVVAQDKKDSEIISVYVYQGGLGLPDRDFYVNTDSSVGNIRAEYVAYIARVLRLLGRTDTAAERAAADVMGLETALAMVSRKLEDTRDPLTNYHRMSPDDFRRDHTPSIQWMSRLAAWDLPSSYLVVGQPEYFDALDRVLTQTPIPVLKDYLRFHLASAYAEYLDPVFETEHFHFYDHVLMGQKEQAPAGSECLMQRTLIHSAVRAFLALPVRLA